MRVGVTFPHGHKMQAHMEWIVGVTFSCGLRALQKKPTKRMCNIVFVFSSRSNKYTWRK